MDIIPTPTKPRKSTTAAAADITLPDNEFEQDLDMGYGLYDNNLDFGVPGIESQQFESFELDLGLDNLDAMSSSSRRSPAKRKRRQDGDDEGSVELGRDAPDSAARKSARHSSILGDFDGGADFGGDNTRRDSSITGDFQFEPELDGFQAGQLDLSGDLDGGLDLQLDFNAPTRSIDGQHSWSS